MTIRAIHYVTGEVVAVHLVGSTIGRIESFARDAALADLPIVAPGLVDVQINGFAGRDFNGSGLEPDAVAEVVRGIAEEGVTTFFPTVITNASPSIERNLRAIARACDVDRMTRDAVGGIHLEGPFISPQEGARGAHAQEFVRPPDWELFSRWQDAAGGRIRLVTLSPESPQAVDFIARAVRSGVIASVGHTAATPEQIREAVSAGARMSTHFGNGAHLMLPRHPNYLWEQLAQDDLWASVIADGFHLPDQVLKVVMRVKKDRAILVSDAVALTGLPPGRYAASVGRDVVLTPQGRLHLASDERLLAGSAQMLPHCVQHLISRGLARLPDAWEMASLRPARMFDLPQAMGLQAGAPADLVLFRPTEGGLTIEHVYKAGAVIRRC